MNQFGAMGKKKIKVPQNLLEHILVLIFNEFAFLGPLWQSVSLRHTMDSLQNIYCQDLNHLWFQIVRVLTRDLIHDEILGGQFASLSTPPSLLDVDIKWLSLWPEISISCEPMLAWSLTDSKTCKQKRRHIYRTKWNHQGKKMPSISH